MTSFGARLHAAIAERGPFCVGIDPHAALLHEWGLADDVAGLERFALTAVEAVAPHVSVVKPQSAFYERFGSRGIAVLERVIAESRAAGALVLLDVKRGDIGSTSQAYADAYLDPASPLASDAITVSPYLGFGSLDPMVDTARKHDAGVFVLALTSNKEGPEVQHATADGGGTVAGRMLDHLRRLNAGAEPLGSFGAVVGATIGLPTGGEDLDFNGPILAPGFGAQGGTVADIRRIFGDRAPAVLPELVARGAARRPGRRGDARRRTPRQRRAARVRRLALLGVLPCVAAVAGRLRRPSDDYCDAVEEHQEELSEVLGDGEPDALLKALDIFSDLADKAPERHHRRVAAGRHPDRGAARRARRRRGRPGDLRPRPAARRTSPRSRRRASTRPRRQLGSGTTLRALQDLDQQARDVCKTPLTL